MLNKQADFQSPAVAHVSTSLVTPRAGNIPSPIGSRKPSQMSNNDTYDEFGEGPKEVPVGSVRATSSLGSSEFAFVSSGLVRLGPIGSLDKQSRVKQWRKKLNPNQSPWSSRPASSLSASYIPPRVDKEAGEDGECSREGLDNAGSSVGETSSCDGDAVVTRRFEHKEDEDGHHVLLGMEGKHTKCEDEPIRIPGAVQAFGVLMVVHDDFETGQVKVRQVSEVCARPTINYEDNLISCHRIPRPFSASHQDTSSPSDVSLRR